MDYLSAHKDVCSMLTRLSRAILAGQVALADALAFGRELLAAEEAFSRQVINYL